MQLTLIAATELPYVLARFARSLAGHPSARRAFGRIAGTLDFVPDGADRPVHRMAAVALARSFGIPVLDEPPRAAFSWDGRFLRVDSEASVVLHEVAHWQLCPPDRRKLADFGLGAGPETGRKADADHEAATDFATRQEEETLASLLGILWEARLAQPAILAFLEQNWLEGWDRSAAAENFIRAVETLSAAGLVDADGWPTRRVRGDAARTEEVAAHG